MLQGNLIFGKSSKHVKEVWDKPSQEKVKVHYVKGTDVYYYWGYSHENNEISCFIIIFSSIIAEKINGSKEALFNKKYTTTITRL